MVSFSALLNRVKNNVQAFTSEKPAKAAIGASIYVGKSGGMSDAEFDTMVEQIQGNPRFANVDVDAILAGWEEYKSDRLFKRDLMALLSEIKDSENKTVREDICITAIETAESEDGIDEDENNRLNEVGAAIGIAIQALV